MKEKLYIYSKPVPKVVDLIWHLEDNDEVVFSCNPIELFCKLSYYFYNQNNDYYSKQEFVFGDTTEKFLIIDHRKNFILIKQKGKELLKIEPSNDDWDNLNYQIFHILHMLDDEIMHNFSLEEVIVSKFNDKNNKYYSYLQKVISRYKHSDEYFLKETPICLVNMGGGWADIYVQTIDDKVVFLRPGYITNVPWDLLELFIEYLSNENANKTIEFDEEPGNPQFVIQDNKLFVKRDYDAEEEEVAGSKLEQAKAFYKNIGRGLKDWFSEFTSLREDNEKYEEFFNKFKTDYEKLGELIKQNSNL